MDDDVQLAAAVLAAATARNINSGRPTPNKDFSGEVWELYQHFHRLIAAETAGE